MYSSKLRRIKLIIAGGRKFFNYAFLREKVDKFIETHNIDRGDLEIVSGGAKGADWFGELYARANNLPVKVFKANWNRFGRGAGPKRNGEMADYATHCIVFPVYKQSVGSYDMARQALNNGLILEIWETRDDETARVD